MKVWKPHDGNGNMTINLKKYKKAILAEEDKLLFSEVEKCASADAFRAAYILTWIACAESFKRRFKEASKRDHVASAIVQEIQDKENQKKAVDSYLLNKAEEYGFINAAVKAKLDNILTFRSVYAHPYEDAPSEEELLNAITIVVSHVLSQPVKLKHGFIASQLKEVFGNQNFLDDLKISVTAYADEILPRIAEDLYPYMLDKILEEAEKNIGDASMRIFTRRGSWLAMSLVSRCIPIFTATDWHTLANKYPQIAPFLLSDDAFFKAIGDKAQDSVVGHILSSGASTPSTLTLLEKLLESDALSKRQAKRFRELIDKFNNPYHGTTSAEKLRASGLKLKTCFFTIVPHLKSSNWYTQNPIATMILNGGPSQILELDDAQQEELGRNVLQAADGGAGDSYVLLTKIAKDSNSWPYKFIYGIAVECFVNEKNKFRFKTRKFEEVSEILKALDTTKRTSLLDDVMKAIDPSELKFGDEDDLHEFVESMKSEVWSKGLCAYLKKTIPTKIKDKKAKAAA